MTPVYVRSDRDGRDVALSGARRLFEQAVLSESFILLLTVVYFLAMVVVTPSILTVPVLLDILNAMAPLLVVAIGQTFVLIVAGIDLSAPSVLAMASVVGASVMTGRRRLSGQWQPAFEIVGSAFWAFVAVGRGDRHLQRHVYHAASACPPSSLRSRR